uniref:Uncharacterized protein n=1 Tax=Arundo donax TaxID=35708 RepID=A0A0A9BGY7_ARUDO
MYHKLSFTQDRILIYTSFVLKQLNK